MQQEDLIKAVLPGVIAGGILYVISSFVGPFLGPGWADVLHGGSFFVGLIWVGFSVLGLMRRRAAERQSDSKKQ